MSEVVYRARPKRFVVSEVLYDTWADESSGYRAHESFDNLLDARVAADRLAATCPDAEYVVQDTQPEGEDNLED